MLFRSDSYRHYLRDRIEAFPGEGRGVRTQIARLLNCQSTFISQVLRDKAHFSPEHIPKLNRFFEHTDLESRYFLNLVMRDRAGSQDLRALHERELENLKKLSMVGVGQSITQFLKQFEGEWVSTRLSEGAGEFIGERFEIRITGLELVWRQESQKVLHEYGFTWRDLKDQGWSFDSRAASIMSGQLGSRRLGLWGLRVFGRENPVIAFAHADLNLIDSATLKVVFAADFFAGDSDRRRFEVSAFAKRKQLIQNRNKTSVKKPAS